MELKKGDMVEIRILRTPILRSEYNIGDICEVKSIVSNFPENIAVYTKDKKDFWYFSEDELKLIEPTTETQKKQILRHLQESSITSWEAINKYRITRLADVIYRLRKDHNITKEIIKENKKQWAKYTLIK